MSRVEVLTPVRLETRFVDEGAGGWTLRLRVYPDDFSLGRSPAPPIAKELEVLKDALGTVPPGEPDPKPREVAAFRSAAAALGARRAWWLWRTATAVVDQGAGPVRIVSTAPSAPALSVGTPIGVPDALDVWLLFTNGTRRRVATLHPNATEIAKDLQADAFTKPGNSLPALWWLDYERAAGVGLAADIPLTGAEAFGIATLVVVGAGKTSAADLIAAHAASGRLAPVAQGTPTNTVAGMPTTPLGDDPDTWGGLLEVSAANQNATVSLLQAFGIPPAEQGEYLPLPQGDLRHLEFGRAAVQGLWPLLWGRALRDVVGAAGREPALAAWAAQNLAVQGPLPAIRVGEQPYGLLPTSLFSAWQDDPNDDPDVLALEKAIVDWARHWRSGAAAAAAAGTNVLGASPVVGADTEQLLRLYGRHAPSAFWRVRPILDLAELQAIEIQHGYAVSLPTEYDVATARAWRGIPYPLAQVAPAGPRWHLPGPPKDGEPLIDVDPPNLMMRPNLDQLRKIIQEHPEPLYTNSERTLGLLGHLIRESMIASRAVVGRAWLDANSVAPPDPAQIDRGRQIPLDDNFQKVVIAGTDTVSNELFALGGVGEELVTWFWSVQKACELLVDASESDAEGVLRAVKAALDTASFRVDPWLIGVAYRRLVRLANDSAPFLLGAYGWVDAPRPWVPNDPDVLRPGPTAAGLLHAPSFAQAQVAAVFRDAAVNDPTDNRWELDLDSDKVRRAVAFGERVRLGVHPFEALGLEVETVAGDPDAVRVLRTEYPTVPVESVGAGPAEPNDPTRRVCDGVQVLDAARAGTLPAGLPPELAAELAPLDALLDTYADLLLVDGIHALVTRSPEAGGSAMEAAAGLAPPPELRCIRTPREATSVEVSCWAVLPVDPAEGQGADVDPVVVADPGFAMLVGPDELNDPANPVLVRATAMLGGSEAAGVPSTTHVKLVAAMTANLSVRWQTVADLASAAHASVSGAGAVDEQTLDRQWRLGLHKVSPDWSSDDRRKEAEERLGERKKLVDDGVPGSVGALQAGIRSLLARPDLPVLAVVERSELPDGWDQPVQAGALDRDWLEIVAAVRPRLAPLEAHQVTADEPWPASLIAPDDKVWSKTGPVQVFYGPGVTGEEDKKGKVSVALLDSWVDSVPSRQHTTQAAFGFNAPKARAPQAVLLAVPPDLAVPLTDVALLGTVLEVRELTRARAARPTDRGGLPWATPSPTVQLEQPCDFLSGWPT